MPNAEDIRALLRRQLASPVRWADLIRALAAAGATTFVECGPGKVLTGLNRRIDKQPTNAWRCRIRTRCRRRWHRWQSEAGEAA